MVSDVAVLLGTMGHVGREYLAFNSKGDCMLLPETSIQCLCEAQLSGGFYLGEAEGLSFLSAITNPCLHLLHGGRVLTQTPCIK